MLSFIHRVTYIRYRRLFMLEPYGIVSYYYHLYRISYEINIWSKI